MRKTFNEKVDVAHGVRESTNCASASRQSSVVDSEMSQQTVTATKRKGAVESNSLPKKAKRRDELVSRKQFSGVMRKMDGKLDIIIESVNKSSRDERTNPEDLQDLPADIDEEGKVLIMCYVKETLSLSLSNFIHEFNLYTLIKLLFVCQ